LSIAKWMIFVLDQICMPTNLFTRFKADWKGIHKKIEDKQLDLLILAYSRAMIYDSRQHYN